MRGEARERGLSSSWLVLGAIAVVGAVLAAVVLLPTPEQGSERAAEKPASKPKQKVVAQPLAPGQKSKAHAKTGDKSKGGAEAKKNVRIPPKPRVFRSEAAGRVVEVGDYKGPRAVDVAPDGRWLVAEKGANRIVVDDGNGNKKYLFATAPDDADFLPGGGYLVTSSKDSSVVELDEKGNTVWRYKDLKRPMDADRLPNGNALIADARPGRVLEVDRDGDVVWSHQEGLLFPWDVELAADGNVWVADYNRHHVRCIQRDGDTCWKLNHIGHPSSLQLLDGDRGFLVATHKAGSVVWSERDRIRAAWRLGPDLEDFAILPSGDLLVAQAMRAEAAVSDVERDEGLLGLVRALAERVPEVDQSEPVGVTALADVDTKGNNLIVVLFDSLRYDHMPWHGYWRDTAPRLTELARNGLIFDQYITQAPWTKPSVASLLTSTYATTHGATSQKPQSQLPVSLSTIAEILSEAGYFTAAVMQNPHMGDRKSSKGFEQGYQHYEYVGGKKFSAKQPQLNTTRAIEILEQRPAGRPFFLTMFFMNPHYPYEPHHEVFGGKVDGPSNPGPINHYDAEVAEADAQVGRLLDFLEAEGLADRTIVVFSSDHGEEFGDHGKRFHGDTLYDCVINVPLVISGLDRVGRFAGLVREVDLMPTILDYLGLAAGDELRTQMVGTSVRPFLEPGVTRTGLIAYSQSRFRDNVHLVSERSESRKVVADFKAGKAMIFDLENDPRELRDLATEETSAAELARLERWETGLDLAEPDVGPTEVIPEEVLERLRAAGYLGDE